MKKIQLIGIFIVLSMTYMLIPQTVDAHVIDTGTNITPKSQTNFDFSLFTEQTVEIEKHTMEISINKGEAGFTTEVTSTLNIRNIDTEPLGYFFFAINETIGSLFAKDQLDEPLSTQAISKVDSTELNVTLPKQYDQDEEFLIRISYEIERQLITSFPEHLRFDTIITQFQGSENFIVKVALPIGYDMIEEGDLLQFGPPFAIREVDDGRVIIKWNKGVISNGFVDLFFIHFVTTVEPITEIPSSFYALIGVAFFMGIAASSLVYFFIFKRKFQPTKSKLVTSLLSDSEQAVIKAINEEGGMAIQRKICERTGFSKSKVSQILLKLEEKDVLKRERWGRTNRVTITNENFKNIELDPKVEPSKDD